MERSTSLSVPTGFSWSEPCARTAVPVSTASAPWSGVLDRADHPHLPACSDRTQSSSHLPRTVVRRPVRHRARMTGREFSLVRCHPGWLCPEQRFRRHPGRTTRQGSSTAAPGLPWCDSSPPAVLTDRFFVRGAVVRRGLGLQSLLVDAAWSRRRTLTYRRVKSQVVMPTGARDFRSRGGSLRPRRCAGYRRPGCLRGPSARGPGGACSRS